MRVAQANVYVSEGTCTRILSTLKRAAESFGGQGDGVVLASTFHDAPYNRSSFSFCGEPRAVARAAAVMCAHAIDLIDISVEGAGDAPVRHPRLGACDHIAFFPLSPGFCATELAVEALRCAQDISERHRNLPVLLYGAVHPGGTSLAQVRRGTPYFRSCSHSHTRAHAGEKQDVVPLPSRGRLGPELSCSRSGLLMLGCAPFVSNYNVPLRTSDLPAARRIAAGVRERGGAGTRRGTGLAQVEALALPHVDGFIEVACNLLNDAVTSPAAVLQRVCELAEAEGIAVGEAYTIGASQEEALRLGSNAVNAAAMAQAQSK